MLRFSFTLYDFDGALVKEHTAYYLVDGTLRLQEDAGVVSEEVGVPLVELAVWLSGWLAAPHGARSFLPEGYVEDEGPMLHLAPVGSARYRLTYAYAEPVVSWVAEQAEWNATFTRFIDELRIAVQVRYQVTLEQVLPPVQPH